MAYTAILSCNFGSYTPTLSNVRISVDGQTISSGITAIANSNGSGFQATVTTLTDSFRGPFTFYDSTDATKFCIGSVGPEHEILPTVSTFDASTEDVTTDLASRTASQTDISSLATSAGQTTTQNAITALNDIDSTAVQSAAAAAITAAQPLDANITQVTGTPVSDVDDFKAASVVVDTAAIADAVWDEPTSDHQTAGTFGLLMSGVATASAVATAVWAASVRTLTSAVGSLTGNSTASNIKLRKNVSFEFTWSGLTIPVTWNDVHMTIKTDPDQEIDSASVLQLKVSATTVASDGITYLNGSTYTPVDDGSLVVDQGAGTIVMTVKRDAMKQLPLCQGMHFDVILSTDDNENQLLIADGLADVVRSVGIL